MEAFRKVNSQGEFHQSFKSQSAMEYLMTYGWAILIIAVVLAALFELGIFNPLTFAPKASPGSCQVVRPEGAGTTNFISLEGECNGELPQYVGYFNGNAYINGSLGGGFDTGTPVSITLTAWVSSKGPVPEVAVGPVSYGCTSGLYEAGLNTISSNDTRYHGCCDDYAASPFTGLNLYGGNWYFVALSYSDVTHTIIFVVNNNVQTDGVTFASNQLGGLNFWIGRDMCDKWFLTGYMSNLQVYNTALSANDLESLYQEGIGGAPINVQSLVGWWPLNGNANDYSGNGNNGVPSGITYTSNWYSGYSAP